MKKQIIYITLAILFSSFDIVAKAGNTLCKDNSIIKDSSQIDVSSGCNDSFWGKGNLYDGNNRSGWSSKFHKDPNQVEWVVIDLGGIKAVEGIYVTFRSEENSSINNVPEYFVLQYTTAADSSWTDIPKHRYTSVYKIYDNPGREIFADRIVNVPYPNTLTDNHFKFDPIFARKVRLKAVKLRSDGKNNYCLQIMELTVEKSDKDVQRFYTSLGGQFDADLNNFYNIKALAKNQKDFHRIGISKWLGPVIGAKLNWAVPFSGGGCAWLSKIVWDEEEKKKLILDNALCLPVTEVYKVKNKMQILPVKRPNLDEAGLVWVTALHFGHLRHSDSYLYESNANYIVSIWDYLKWSRDRKSIVEVPDRTLIIRDNSAQSILNNVKSDYVHRIGKFVKIGQKFTIDSPFKSVSLKVYSEKKSRYKIELRKSDELLVQKNFEGVNDWIKITNNSDQWQAGRYHIELTNCGDYFDSPVGWYTSYGNALGTNGIGDQEVATVEGVSQYSLLDNARIAMKYYLDEMGGRDGIIVIDSNCFLGEIHQGNRENAIPRTGVNRSSSYWDVPRFGYKNAWHNAFYYAALEAMANIEEMIGDANQAKLYRDKVMPVVKQDYTKHFWSQKTGRFITQIGTSGEKLDFGHTPTNLMAVYFGLADKTQSNLIVQWLNGDRIIAQDTSKGKDIYKFGFASRVNTLDMKSTGSPYWWYAGLPLGYDINDASTWGWSIKPDGTGKADFGNWEQNGGAKLFYSYYDIKNRIALLDADNAWERFKVIIDEYHKDGFYRFFPEVPSHYVVSLLAAPIEGMPILAYIEGFLGIEITHKGMRIKPFLPEELDFAGVKGLVYGTNIYDVEISRSCKSPYLVNKGAHYFELKVPAKIEIILKDNKIICCDLNVGGKVNPRDVYLITGN